MSQVKKLKEEEMRMSAKRVSAQEELKKAESECGKLKQQIGMLTKLEVSLKARGSG